MNFLLKDEWLNYVHYVYFSIPEFTAIADFDTLDLRLRFSTYTIIDLMKVMGKIEFQYGSMTEWATIKTGIHPDIFLPIMEKLSKMATEESLSSAEFVNELFEGRKAK